MRKLFAITMLVTYLFNLAGYNAFFQYSIGQADRQLIQQLDENHYNENQLVEVKIKLNLPYMSDWTSYERYDGEVEFQGTHYNYVKRKISHDTLYLLCTPNQGVTELYKGKSNYLVNVNDIPSGKENSNNSAAKKNISCNDYKHRIISFDFALAPVTGQPGNHLVLFHFPNLFIDTPGKPPEADC